MTPGNVAFYTMLHLRCGRRSHSAGRSDVMGTRTQIVGLSRVTSLALPMPSEDNSADDEMTLGDVLASDAEDPSETAARNLDWQALVATLDERALAVLHCMAGRRPVARSGHAPWRVSHDGPRLTPHPACGHLPPERGPPGRFGQAHVVQRFARLQW